MAGIPWVSVIDHLIDHFSDKPHSTFAINVNRCPCNLVSRACMPHLALSPNPHVLTIAPAPMADHTWLSPHTVYSASKIAMGFLSLALEAEFGSGGSRSGSGSNGGVAFNTLWPRYAVATAGPLTLLPPRYLAA